MLGYGVDDSRRPDRLGRRRPSNCAIQITNALGRSPGSVLAYGVKLAAMTLASNRSTPLARCATTQLPYSCPRVVFDI
ncbi:unnamed protein product [Leptosia nina]|uniref:Uncharacterized protein n=1 Tax=Leptosia nina TaxID=320188 RepID=A0AAV1K1L4_9NEOP